MTTSIKETLENFRKQELFTDTYCEYGFLKDPDFKYRYEFKNSDRSIFDLASLTKLFSTGLLISDYSIRNNKPLDSRLGDFFNVELGLNDFLLELKVSDLLSHQSLLPAWRNFFTYSDDSKESGLKKIEVVLNRIPKSELIHKDTYSDLGYIILGYALTLSENRYLDQLFEKWKSLNKITADISYYSDSISDRVVPTGYSKIKGGKSWSGIHDENAFFLDVPCGHAGLFCSGEEFSKALRLLIQTQAWKKLVEKSFDLKRDSYRPNPLSFRKADDFGSEDFFPNSAIGHYGFTGTSFWFNPKTTAYVFLLTNRTFYKRLDSRIRELRKIVSKEAYEYLKK